MGFLNHFCKHCQQHFLQQQSLQSLYLWVENYMQQGKARGPDPAVMSAAVLQDWIIIIGTRGLSLPHYTLFLKFVF